MSVFGGESWAREAQHRKRRVDDLLLDGIDAASYKKLSNGKFACLICPQNPILDTLIMLSTHVKHSCHRTAAMRFRDRELARREEVNKRVAFSDSPSRMTSSKPLIQQVHKVASEVYCSGVDFSSRTSENPVSESGTCDHGAQRGVTGKVQQLDSRERREKELKFTAAGWKRDCHGSWFKDENVEFDSDEEDPNDVLTDTS
ncbi:sodium channel modifier 1-like [Dorcoceras hygrometricum]|uniref:Sodium channel modifier 1 n=1 Tax=Dorcoceras hygrometricum TaxID=472368 RepID=A0A2Z7DFS8_9LAMI|nr:sodium channel modifier 1-like [Dorcoceras hygrometricum]